MHVRTLLTPLLLCLSASLCLANEVEVGQKDKSFTLKALKLKVGDSINFKNEDPFFHNVFSLSDSKTFDLGSYPQGQSKKVVFDKAGTIEIECAIHPGMKLVVEVAP